MNVDSKYNPFGNFNEPWPPKTYKPKVKGWRRKLSWWWRNPLHNFCFFWIGYAGNNWVTCFHGNFLDAGWGIGYLVASLKGDLSVSIYRRIVSYRGKHIEWYIGWRSNGAFGIALRRANSPDSSEVTK